jgi:hypothetical protein
MTNTITIRREGHRPEVITHLTAREAIRAVRRETRAVWAEGHSVAHVTIGSRTVVVFCGMVTSL